MVTEHVILPITVATANDFEKVFDKAGRLLRAADGCRGVRLGRGIEHPSSYLLLIEWDSVESHKAFTGQPAFQEFRTLIGPFLSGKPAMEHFDSVYAA